MGAGACLVRSGSGLGGANTATNQGGGSALIGLMPLAARTTNGATTRYARTRSYGGPTRHWIFCQNQLGGVGRKRSQFGPGNKAGVSSACALLALQSRQANPIDPLFHIHWVYDPDSGWMFYNETGPDHPGAVEGAGHAEGKHTYLGTIVECDALGCERATACDCDGRLGCTRKFAVYLVAASAYDIAGCCINGARTPCGNSPQEVNSECSANQFKTWARTGSHHGIPTSIINEMTGSNTVFNTSEDGIAPACIPVIGS